MQRWGPTIGSLYGTPESEPRLAEDKLSYLVRWIIILSKDSLDIG